LSYIVTRNLTTNKAAAIEDIDLSVNPITGLPDTSKRYVYGPNYVAPEKEGQIISDGRLEELLSKIRWKGARKINGYKFTGIVKPPKSKRNYLNDL